MNHFIIILLIICSSQLPSVTITLTLTSIYSVYSISQFQLIQLIDIMSDPNGTAETLAPARFTADDVVRMHKTFPRQWPIAKLEKHKNLLLNSDF